MDTHETLTRIPVGNPAVCRRLLRPVWQPCHGLQWVMPLRDPQGCHDGSVGEGEAEGEEETAAAAGGETGLLDRKRGSWIHH